MLIDGEAAILPIQSRVTDLTVGENKNFKTPAHPILGGVEGVEGVPDPKLLLRGPLLPTSKLLVVELFWATIDVTGSCRKPVHTSLLHTALRVKMKGSC